MKWVLTIAILSFTFTVKSQRVKGKYIHKSIIGTTTLKIKSRNRYKIKFRYNREEWYNIKHPLRLGKMCIPPGHKKPKRNKIKRGEWRTNDDTLFLTSSNYYLRSKEGLNKFGSDGLIHYKKVFW